MSDNKTCQTVHFLKYSFLYEHKKQKRAHSVLLWHLVAISGTISTLLYVNILNSNWLKNFTVENLGAILSYE